MSSLDSLRRFLLAGRNPDGGWGYSPGKASRLEPTCWALLALQGLVPDATLCTTIEHWPSRDGLLIEGPGGEPNFAFHALGLLVLQALNGEHATTNVALIHALQRGGGVRLDGPNVVNRQNNTLQGWSWIPDTFSWVEPTAWALLALKKCQRTVGAQIEDSRLAEAEALLLDRCCVLGGWNYGNSNMFGRELHPYVPTTAIALLALQSHTSRETLTRSLTFLSGQASTERSSYAMSIARVALTLFGLDQTGLTDALDGQVSVTCDLGYQLGAAQALYALRKHDDYAAFRL